ncbi:MAG: AI-2E family transporter [Rhodospirillales bacterium]|nr:AI-2E family transporter [Rhodospirillaceae bacterium]MDP6428029.1 AI-2E family transporter [Rhodospirillales bacterium]MDP6643787.1 AI-2E family transporter [Rhodospirillales bacterium]MDP6842351.1 AI-2E family transporter [Rhodospirillales bacterium]
MSRERQFWIWAAVLAVAVALLFLVGGVLFPFIAGFAVAYFLDPIVDWIEKQGASRLIATLAISIIFFAVVVALVILIAPLLQQQIIGFFGKVPAIIDAVTLWLEPLKETLQEKFPDRPLDDFGATSKSFGSAAAAWLIRVLGGIWQGGLALFNAISLIVITPVVSFYLLRDWDRIVGRIDGWLPRQFAPAIRTIFSDIDRAIAGFVRGQMTVGLFLAAIYGIGLTLVGLDFGLLVGIATGLISFIPYFGMLIGMAVAVAIAVVQFAAWQPVALVLLVFAVGQLIESIFLTPKFVGDKVRLHAVWVIFALMVGGALFGFTGILLAIPVAATIGVVIRFSLDRYLESALYKGVKNEAEAEDGGEN